MVNKKIVACFKIKKATIKILSHPTDWLVLDCDPGYVFL